MTIQVVKSANFYCFLYIKNAQYPMRKLCVLIHEDVIHSSVSGVLDLLNAANELADAWNKPRPFQVELIGERLKNIQLDASAQFICSKTLDDVIERDLVIIPPFKGNPDVVLKKHSGMIRWIERQVSFKGEWASLCLGAYFLAEAGLLENKRATSHWKVFNDLKAKYPAVHFLPDQIITDHDGIYTSGGAFSSFNLIIYLIEKFCGKEWAIAISKDFSIDMDRTTQTHFAIFKGQRSHHDEAIYKAQDFIEENFLEPITIDTIAAHCNMSRRNFIRRFIAATGRTPLEYIQHLKIEVAKRALENTDVPIASVMYDAGYNDSNTFRGVFKKVAGLTPQAYQKKYNRFT
jgi:transcriptional regulator GlxA family with amidase domain